MKLKNKPSRYIKILSVIWLLSAVLAGIGYFLLYLPLQLQIAQINNKINISNTALHEAQLAAQKKTQLQQKKQYNAAQNLIKKFSVPSDTVTGMVFGIGRIASDLSLIEFSSKNQTDQESSAAESETEKQIAEVWLNVDFKATFNQFIQFVNRLESDKPMVFIESLLFRKDIQNSKMNTVSLDLSFLKQIPVTSEKLAQVSD